MLRFFVNFILFGILFYLIWRFFPEAFDTLVSWAGAGYEFIKSLISTSLEKMQKGGANF